MFTNVVTAVASSTAVTFGLLYIMQFLISLSPIDPPPMRDHGELCFCKVDRREDPPVRDEPIMDRDFVKPPELPQHANRPVADDFGIGVRNPGPVAPADRPVGLVSFLSDGPLVALVRVEPTYPPAAAARGLEGYVLVSFDVGADGTVSNVVVVESSHRIFERAAIHAAQRFRYKARVVDGIPLPTRGVQTLLTFNMQES